MSRPELCLELGYETADILIPASAVMPPAPRLRVDDWL